MARLSLRALLVVVPALLAACAAPAPDGTNGVDGVNAEAAGETGSALVTGTLAKDATLATTARLNFRAGPSTSDTIYKVLSLGATVKALGGEPTNGFYKIEVAGKEGWAFGKYLKATTDVASTDTEGDDDDNGAPPSSSSAANVSSTGSCGVSWYATGKTTASGAPFKPDGISAAHKTLPFGTKVRVTNLSNEKSVTVEINDRGPFIKTRCLDLSRGAFRQIASLDTGVLDKSLIKYEILE